MKQPAMGRPVKRGAGPGERLERISWDKRPIQVTFESYLFPDGTKVPLRAAAERFSNFDFAGAPSSSPGLVEHNRRQLLDLAVKAVDKAKSCGAVKFTANVHPGTGKVVPGTKNPGGKLGTVALEISTGGIDRLSILSHPRGGKLGDRAMVPVVDAVRVANNQFERMLIKDLARMNSRLRAALEARRKTQAKRRS